MKIYLAARYPLLLETKEYGKLLEEDGHVITANWLDGKEEGKTWEDVANMDLADVSDADAVVLFTEDYGTAIPGGGRHVEFGYGMALGKKMFIVGPKENIFHWCRNVTDFPRFEYLRNYLKGR